MRTEGSDVGEDRAWLVKEIFDKARSLPPAEREKFVRERIAGTAEGDRASIADEVLGLLRELDEAAGFLDVPTGAARALAGAMLAEQSGAEGVGSRIGEYHLLEQIGEGGFGLVYMAEQERPIRRRVALKVIKLGMDTKQVIARFEQERQALAMMDHPNIAKVLDAGTTPSGRPYFVMELVKGLPITQYCDEHRLDVQDRVAIFAHVCHAVQHAHQKGIIHRDIKPSNVLVTVADGERPVPKVIDFGIAKATEARLTEKTLFTEFRQMIGTPEYMSPEQAGLGGEGGADIDTRSDVYSLGVLLYELLTGVTPFDPRELRSAAFDELRRIIREVDPPRPSTRLSTMDTLAEVAAKRRTEPLKLRVTIRGELDWIVMRCMEKERVRRYSAAADIARDVARYLAHEPLEAGPVGAGYRMRKFMRRNRRAVFASALLLVILVLGLVGTTTGALWALRARDRAEESERDALLAADAESKERSRADQSAKDAKRLAYRLALGAAAAGLEQGKLEHARSALADAPEEHRGWEWDHLAWACDRTSTTFETPPDTGRVAVSGDGQLVFTRGTSGEVLIFDAATGRLERSLQIPAGGPWQMFPLSPNYDGSLLIVSNSAPDSLVEAQIMLWETATGRQLWSESSTVLCGASFTSGRWRRTPDGAVRVGLLDEQVLDTLSFRGADITSIVGPFNDLRRVVVRTRTSASLVLDLDTGEELGKFFSNTSFLVGEGQPTMIYDWGAGLGRIDIETGEVRRLGIMRDSSSVPSPAGRDAFAIERTRGVLDVYAWPSEQRIFQLKIPRYRRNHAVRPGGGTVYVVEANGRVRAIDLPSGQPFSVAAEDHGGYVSAICPTGLRIASAGWGSVRVFDSLTGEEIASAYLCRNVREGLYAAAFSPDGRLLAVGGRTPDLTVLDPLTGSTVATLGVPGGVMVCSLAWSPDANKLLAGLWDGRLLEFEPGAPGTAPTEWPDPHTGPVLRLEFSPEGSHVLSSSRQGARLPDHWMVAGDADNSVRLRRSSPPHASATLFQSRAGIWAATFHPDGETMAVSADGALALVRCNDGTVLAQLPTTVSMSGLAFNATGSLLAACGAEVCVFRTDQLELLSVVPSEVTLSTIRFAPDGERLLGSTRYTPVIAFETGPAPDPIRRGRVMRARPAVDRAFKASKFVSGHAMEMLRADASLPADVRAVALQMAVVRGDDPNQIQNRVALEPPAPGDRAAWAVHAERMEAAMRSRPTDPGMRATLGLCQLRAGNPRDALETMQAIVDAPAEGRHEYLVRAWAVIALARCDLGEIDAAADAVRNAARARDELGSEATRASAALVAEATDRVAAAGKKE